MSAKNKREEEKKIISEVFNLDNYEFVDEYTDKNSEHLPDCYLRSKKEGLPDLAIEVKTLERDYDRTVDDKTLDQIQKQTQGGIMEHSFSIRNLHIVLELELPLYKNIPPKQIMGTCWDDLKKELNKYKQKWEYILGRISEIEKILEDEEQEKYVKDLSYQKKEQLKKIIDDIERQDERFLKYNITYSTYLCLDIHVEVCPKKVRDLKTTIQNSKEEGLKWRIEDFLKDYFSKKLGISPKQVVIDGKSSENGFIFTIWFVLYWKREEEVEFYIKEIERYVEESNGKFENLRKVKSDKSDDSPYWELLLVKGKLVVYHSFNSLIEEIEEQLKKNGYDYLLLVRERKGGEDNEFITLEIENGIVRILDGGWEGVYYLIIRMDGGTGSSVEDDWKTQIRKIIKLKIHEKPDYSIANALDNPEKFAEEVDKLIEAYPSYKERLIRDLRASLKQCTLEKALKLIKEIVKRSTKKDILLEIVKLLIDTFEENLIPVDYKDELWEVIDGILNKLDKLEIEGRIRLRDIVNDKYNFTIFNTVEGAAIASLILYTSWLKENNKIKDLNSIPGVKGRLEYYLNNQTSIIIHAVYGFYLHTLLKIDEHWTKDMMPKIFPKDRVEHFWGAWCAYVQATYLYDEAYSLLREIYCHAIENMKYDAELECNENLVHHLADLYGWGRISLDDDIFHKFWEKANDDAREEFISYVGQYLLKDEKAKDVIERFRALWEWRISYIEGLSNRQDFQKELKSFIHWFVSRKFDDKLALENLIKTVELADEITDEHVYLALDVLLEMANEFPEGDCSIYST